MGFNSGFKGLNIRIFEANVDFMSLGKKNEVRVKEICHMSFLEIHLSQPLQRNILKL